MSLPNQEYGYLISMKLNISPELFQLKIKNALYFFSGLICFLMYFKTVLYRSTEIKTLFSIPVQNLKRVYTCRPDKSYM